MTESKFALVFAADEAYAVGLAAAVYSALVNLSHAFSPEVCVLDNNLSDSSRARLVKIVEATRPGCTVRWIPIPTERLGQVASASHLTPTSYSRLLVPELLPGHIQRAVYLDADVLVRRDLSDLLTIELGNALVGAVRDFAVSSTVHELSGVRENSDPRPYFNTGVLVIDPARWRTVGLGDRALRYAASGEPLRFADQDALNGVVDRWHELDYRWNMQHTHFFLIEPPPPTEFKGQLYLQRRKLYRTAAVLHFIGPKPWHRYCTTPGTTAWVLTLMRTGWLSPGDAFIWLFGYLRNRARYWLGTKRSQLSVLLARPRSRQDTSE